MTQTQQLVELLHSYHDSWCEGCGLMGSWEWKPMAQYLINRGVVVEQPDKKINEADR